MSADRMVLHALPLLESLFPWCLASLDDLELALPAPEL